ncbi:MAG: alpha-ketoglutarate-dependent dioxygenase AlkB [Bacteroidetes bacterium]|nr:alpha-ketoglutarate-dependent dioxygenase AlkB [Bacteroidota bacterium]
MNLFDENRSQTLIHQQGEVIYYSPVLSPESAAEYFNSLRHAVPWKRDTVKIFGRLRQTKREVAWYGDEPYSYTYSNIQKLALPWIRPLTELKSLCEKVSGETYNSCLLNLYHDGTEAMGWHSDDEPELMKDACIASLSLGASRRFVFKHKSSGIIRVC